MRRVGFMTRLSGRGERGAVATIVAALLGMGVVLGFTALSIDVGSLMWERRQVQNGADAVALAMAKTCAEEPAQCVAGGSTQGMLDTLNNQNATMDGTGGYDTAYPSGLCGSGNTLPACAAGSTTQLASCPPVPASLPAGVPFVEAHTQTRATNGTSILPTWFVRTLAGGSTGESVRACARAAYGAPGPTAMSAPITFSMCEWRANTNSGAAYYPYEPVASPGGYFSRPGNPPTQPPWPLGATTPATPGQEIVITLQGGPHMPAACANWQGHDVAGGFGYLSAVGCNATLSTGNWVQVDTGNSLPGCDLAPYWQKVIYLPVFDCVMRSLSAPSGAPPTSPADVCNYGTGNNTWYHLAGWAKFYLSGYKIGGSNEKASPASGSVPCSGGDRCISGWFLEGVLQNAPVAGPPPPPGSPGFGTYAIQPAG